MNDISSPATQTNQKGLYVGTVRLAPLCLGRLKPSKRFTSTHVRSVSALRENIMQPNVFLQAPMGGCPKYDVKCTRNSLHFEVNCNNNNKYIVVLGMPLVYLPFLWEGEGAAGRNQSDELFWE